LFSDSYAIIRVSELNDLPGSDFSTIELLQNGDDVRPISVADAAEICVCSLLDPTACNKSFYVSANSYTKGSAVVSFKEDFSAKFSRLKSNS
jgi:hypothetical protein